jgi:outer membrane receptor protein involved in Fe transport
VGLSVFTLLVWAALHGQPIAAAVPQDQSDLEPLEVSAQAPLSLHEPDLVLKAEQLPPGTDTLARALALVPGVQVLGEGSGRPVLASSRGLGPGRLVVMLDDRPLNDPSGLPLDLRSLPLSALESIEVYRGPLALPGSQGSAGGIIRLRTGDGGAKDHGSLALGGGSFGTLRSALVARRGPLELSLDQEVSDGDFPFVDINGNPRRLANNDSAVQRGHLALDLGHRGRWWSRPSLDWSDLRRGSPGLEQFPSTTGREHSRTLHLSVPFAAPPFGDTLLRGTLGASLWQYQFSDPDPYLPPPQHTQVDSQRGDALLSLRLPALAWVRPFAFVSGAAETSQVLRPRGRQSPSRLLGSAEGGVSLRPASFLAATLAARGDGAEGQGAFFAPRADLSAWVGPSQRRLSLRLHAARSRRLPSLDELYYQGAGIRGNPALLPEDAWALGATTTGTLGPLQTSLTAYHQRLSNLIRFVPVTAYLVEARNLRDATVDGLEGSLDLDLGPLATGASGAWSKSDCAGAPLPGHPRLSGEAHSALTLGPGTLWVRAEGRGAIFLDHLGVRSEEARLLFHTGLDLRPPRPLPTLRLTLRNLTDVRDSVDSYQSPLPGFSAFAEAVFQTDQKED